MPEITVNDQTYFYWDCLTSDPNEWSPPAGDEIDGTLKHIEFRRAARELPDADQNRYATLLSLLQVLGEWTEILIEARTWIGRQTPEYPDAHGLSNMTTPGRIPERQDFQELRSFITQATNGNDGAQAALSQLLSVQSTIWESVAHIARQAEAILIQLMTADKPRFAYWVNLGLVKAREKWEVAAASGLDSILLERAIVNWLHMRWVMASRDMAKERESREIAKEGECTVEHWNGILRRVDQELGDALGALKSVLSGPSSAPSTA